MKKATFDPSKNLDLYFRRGRNGSIDLTFLSEELPYDLTGTDFEFRADFPVSTSINNNVLTLAFSEDTVIKRASYLWQLYNETTGQTWLSGTAYFTESLSAEAEDNEPIEIKINGDQVEIQITATDVNGGTP